MRRGWFRILVELVRCHPFGHNWIYSKYKGYNSKRACKHCFTREVPSISESFSSKITDIEQSAIEDLMILTGVTDASDKEKEAIEKRFEEEGDAPRGWFPTIEDLREDFPEAPYDY